MSDSAVKYIERELASAKQKYKECVDKIHSNIIEIQTIDKKIASLETGNDSTGDVLYPLNSGNTGDVRISMLEDAKENLLSQNETLQKDLDQWNNKVNELKIILRENDSSVVEVNANSKMIIKLNEMERERISRDIHDTVVQNLTALIHKHEFVIQLMNRDTNRAKIELKNIETAVRDCINELRNIIYDLRPMEYNDLGFKTAFLNLCDKLNDTYDVIFNYSIDCNCDLDDVPGMTCLRVINELASNSVRHSNCTNIDIKLYVKDKNITINYCDNGCGFDFDKVIKTGIKNTGYGIKMLKERIDLLNGTVQYENSEGSHFLIQIPI